MTEKRTMMLSPSEWRVIVATGANNIYSFIGQMPADMPPDTVQSTWLHDTLDRLKIQVSAWSASGQPVPTEKTVQWSQQQDPNSFAPSSDAGSATINGTGAATASGSKKKRGWQKGRKRGPRKPKGNEAVQ